MALFQGWQTAARRTILQMSTYPLKTAKSQNNGSFGEMILTIDILVVHALQPLYHE